MMAEKKVFMNVKCRRNFQMMGDQQVEKCLLPLTEDNKKDTVRKTQGQASVKVIISSILTNQRQH